MNQKNSPTSVVGQYFASPGRAWFDRSFPHLASYPIGKIVPDACIPITGNTTVKLDITSMLQTNPTPTPVFDSCKCDVYVFFCPQRNYVRGLQNDNYLELNEIEQMRLPFFGNYQFRDDFPTTIMYGSLLHRLGMPASFATGNGKMHPLDPEMWYNADDVISNVTDGWSLYGKNVSPILAYFDACTYFLANPYDTEIPFDSGLRYLNQKYDDSISDFVLATGRIEDAPLYVYHNLRDIQNIISLAKGVLEENLNGPGEFIGLDEIFSFDSNRITFGNIPITDSIEFNSLNEKQEEQGFTFADPEDVSVKLFGNVMQRTSTTGLFPATFMEDFQSTWFDNKDISSLNAVPLTLTNNNTVQSARIQKSIWNRMLRSIVRGKKLTDWVDIQFGAQLKLSNHPIMVGMDSFNITWDDVLSHNANNGPDGNGVPLGGAAGRGKGGKSTKGNKGNDKTISFTTQEPGYLLIVRSIRPYVSYANNMNRIWDYQYMADFPLPMYSGTQFQDLCVSDICVTNSDTLNNSVIGKQPIYYDHMTGTYTLGGLMSTNLYDSYVFKRAPSIYAYQGDDALALEGLRSTYILRENFDFQFTDWSQNNGENIFIKSIYNLNCFQPLDKQVTKTRL